MLLHQGLFTFDRGAETVDQEEEFSLAIACLTRDFAAARYVRERRAILVFFFYLLVRLVLLECLREALRRGYRACIDRTCRLQKGRVASTNALWSSLTTDGLTPE